MRSQITLLRTTLYSLLAFSLSLCKLLFPAESYVKWISVPAPSQCPNVPFALLRVVVVLRESKKPSYVMFGLSLIQTIFTLVGCRNGDFFSVGARSVEMWIVSTFVGLYLEWMRLAKVLQMVGKHRPTLKVSCLRLLSAPNNRRLQVRFLLFKTELLNCPYIDFNCFSTV